MSIRVTTIEDKVAVTAVLSACYPVLMRPAYDESVLAAALPRMTSANAALLNSGRYFAVCDETGSIIACGGWSHDEPGTGRLTPGRGHIRHFAVHPDHTGRGLGRALYTSCAGQARGQGVHGFDCFSSLNAQAFYSALGFTALGPLKINMGAGAHIASVHMRCAL